MVRCGRASPVCAERARCGAPSERAAPRLGVLGGRRRQRRRSLLGGGSSAARLLGAEPPRPRAPRREPPPRRAPPDLVGAAPRRGSSGRDLLGGLVGVLRRGLLGRSRLSASRSSFTFSSFSSIRALCLRISVSTSMPRWRATVSARARSCLACLSRAVFSSCPVACWKRRLNSSWRALSANSTSCGSSRLCTSTAFITGHRPRGARTSSSRAACGRRGASPRARAAPARRTARTSRGRA